MGAIKDVYVPEVEESAQTVPQVVMEDAKISVAPRQAKLPLNHQKRCYPTDKQRQQKEEAPYIKQIDKPPNGPMDENVSPLTTTHPSWNVRLLAINNTIPPSQVHSQPLQTSTMHMMNPLFRPLPPTLSPYPTSSPPQQPISDGTTAMAQAPCKPSTALTPK